MAAAKKVELTLKERLRLQENYGSAILQLQGRLEGLNLEVEKVQRTLAYIQTLTPEELEENLPSVRYW